MVGESSVVDPTFPSWDIPSLVGAGCIFHELAEAGRGGLGGDLICWKKPSCLFLERGELNIVIMVSARHQQRRRRTIDEEVWGRSTYPTLASRANSRKNSLIRQAASSRCGEQLFEAKCKLLLSFCKILFHYGGRGLTLRQN